MRAKASADIVGFFESRFHPAGRWAALPTLARCRRGVAAVEFALAMTPMLLIVFGFIATNVMFYTLSVMQNSSQYGTMMGATGQAKNNVNGTITAANRTSSNVACSTGSPPTANAALTTSMVEYYACTGLPSWANFSVTTLEDCSVPKFSVTISVNASSAALADIFSFFTSETLTATSVAVKQGTCP
jgi:Flp pilus assembly protein TadG